MAKQITFDILARDRASKTFDTVGDHSEGLGGKLKTLGGGLLKAAKIGTTALAAMGVAGGVMGIKVAAANEQAQISFTTMLGSAQKAGAFIKDLQKFAAETPFDMPGLQTAASSLISAGINADKVIPIMRTLGDVTSGMGTGAEGIQRATVALQQMNAAQRISGEDLNQLRDAGIPVYDLLASATGKSKAEVLKLAQAGKLGHKELGQMMKALETGKGLERFSGLMEKQSHSLTGMWETLKDTIGQGLADAMQPVIPMLKTGMGGAATVLAQVLPKVSDGLKSFVGYLPAIKAWVKDVLPGLQGFGTQILNIGKNLGTLFGPIVTYLGGAVIRSAPGVFRDLMAAIQTTVDVLESLTGFLADHVTALKITAGVIGTILIPKFITLGVQATISATKQVAAWVSTQVASVKSAATSLISSYKVVAGWVAAGAAAVASGAQTVAVWTMYRIESIKSAAGVVLSMARVVAGWVAMGVQSLLSAAKMAAAWLIAMGPIAIAIAAVVGLAVIVVKNWDTIKNATVAAWNAVSSFISGVVSSVLGWVRKHWSLILGILTGPVGLAMSWIVTHWGEVLDFFKGVPGKIRDAMVTVAEAITSPFRTAFNAIARLWNRTVGRLSVNIPGFMGFGGVHFSVPDIPTFARGVNNFSGGLAVVGERGPELVSLPRGSNVYPNGTGPGGVVINVYDSMDGDATARKIKSMLLDLKRTNGGRDLGLA